MSETLHTPVGARLRDLRRARGWTLRDVEERSDGRFTIGSVGAYERGTRVLSAERLVALCLLYDVDPDTLFDEDDTLPELTIVIDLERVEASDELELARLCDTVRRMRRDDTGRRLALRESDLDRLAALRGVPSDTFMWELRQSGLLAEDEPADS